MLDKNYNIVVDYRYKLMYCNPTKSYSCANGRSDDSGDYAFTYTGNCIVETDGGEDDWKIKFLTDGTFISMKSIDIDVFLVGGGGVGGNASLNGGGGDGGGYTTGFGLIAEGGFMGTSGGKGGKGGSGIIVIRKKGKINILLLVGSVR